MRNNRPRPLSNTAALARCSHVLWVTKLFQQFVVMTAALLLCSCGKGAKPADPSTARVQGTPIVSSTAQTNESGNTPYAIRHTQLLSSITQHATRKTSAGYLEVSFDQLSGFSASVTYEIANSNTPAFYYAPRLANDIPAEIKALNGKEVAIQGFMLPLKGEAGRVQEFILLKNQSWCCFGKPPKVNEWVHVRVKGAGFRPLVDQVVTIYGTLQVGEYSENRQMLGIYRLQSDGMGIPRQF